MELNYKHLGNGAPLVILHGLFGTMDNWQSLGKKLAEEYSVYLVDQRNHGRSPHVPVHDYVSLAEDIVDFMVERGLPSATLLGHSMGGKVAMEFALQYPEMMEKLIVVDIAPKQYSGGHERIFQALLVLDLHTIEDRSEAEAVLGRFIEDKGTLQFLLKNLSRHKDGHFEWKMNLPVLHRYYPEIMGPPVARGYFAGETLFIRGGNSDYVLDSDWPDIHAYFPNAQLLTIPGAGHWVHADAPEELLSAVHTFLKGEPVPGAIRG